MLVLCGVVGEEPTYGDLVHYLAYDEALAAIRTINVFRYIQYIMVYVSRLRRKAFSHNFLLGVIRVCSLHYIFTIVASTMYCNK